MNIHFGNQSQFELFPGTTGDPIENSAPRFIFSRIVLTFENVVVIFVFVIVSLIIAFSMGVERGRVKARLARPAAIQSAVPVAMTSVMPNAPISAATPRNTDSVLSGTAIAANVPAGAVSVAPVGSMVRVANPVTVTASPAVVPAAPKVVAASPKAVQPASEKGVDKGYTIQVASYKSDVMAQKELAVLKKKGFESFVMTKGSYVIVCVGKFSGAQAQDEAKKMFNKLKKQYKDSIVRSL